MEIVIGAIGLCIAILFNCWTLWSMKKAQQQNVNIQLLKKRLIVYRSLKDWYTTLNAIIRENADDSFSVTRAFRKNLLNYKEDKRILSYNSQIMENKNLLKTSNIQKEQETLSNKLRKIYIEKYDYILISMKKKTDKINMVPYLFSLNATEIDKINKITNIYRDTTEKMVNYEVTENKTIDIQFDLADNIYEALIEEIKKKNVLDDMTKVLETMENQLTELKYSFGE